MTEELERWVASGFICPLCEDEWRSAPCVFPAFVSWARPDKQRLVMNLRHVNEYMEDIIIKYEEITEFMAALVPFDNLIS